MLEIEVAASSEAITTYRTVYYHNPNNSNCRCNILYIIEEWFCIVCHMCCVCLMFGFDHEIFLLQATGRCATSTKCTSVSDIWWFERCHNSCCAGIKHTITKHTCQQIKILFQWQVVKGVLWRNISSFIIIYLFLILSVVMFAKCVIWSLPLSWFFTAISVYNPTKIFIVYSMCARLCSGLRGR